MLVFELAALAELARFILENSGYARLHGLPLGGGQIQQVGLIFAAAFVVAKSMELFKNAMSLTQMDSRWLLGTYEAGINLTSRPARRSCARRPCSPGKWAAPTITKVRSGCSTGAPE